MSRRVVWRRQIADRFVEWSFLSFEWGRDPAALAHAVAEIDRRLSADPSNEGESRDGNERVLIVHPLSVVYELFDEPGVVLIFTAVLYPGMRA